MAPCNSTIMNSPIRTVAAEIVDCPIWLTQQFIENIYKADDIPPNVKYKRLISYHIEPANVLGENYTTLLYRIQLVIAMEIITSSSTNVIQHDGRQITENNFNDNEETIINIEHLTQLSDSGDDLCSIDELSIDELSTDSGVISAPTTTTTTISKIVKIDSIQQQQQQQQDMDNNSTDDDISTDDSDKCSMDSAMVMKTTAKTTATTTVVDTNNKVNEVKKEQNNEESTNGQPQRQHGQQERQRDEGGQEISITKAYIIKAMPNIDLSKNYVDSCNVFVKETEMYFSIIPQLEEIYRGINNDDDDDDDDESQIEIKQTKRFGPKYIPQYSGGNSTVIDSVAAQTAVAQVAAAAAAAANGDDDVKEISSEGEETIKKTEEIKENPSLKVVKGDDDDAVAVAVEQQNGSGVVVEKSVDENAAGVAVADNLISNIIILEDLKASGFRMANRVIGLDMEHSRAVLKKLAKFHAASARLYELKGDYSEQLREGMYNDRMASIFESFYDNTFSIFHDCVTNHWPSGHLYSEQVASWRKNLFSTVQKNFIVNPNSFNVLNHGDLWTNNFMFKYNDQSESGNNGSSSSSNVSSNGNERAPQNEKRKTIQDLIFIDLQLCVWGSPAIDLNYFIMSSCAPSLKINEFDNFIRYYHKHLIKALRTFGYGMEMPTLAALQQDVLDRGFLAVMATTGILPMVLMEFEVTDAIDVSCFMKSDPESVQMKRKLYNNPTYVEIMEKLLPVFNSKGLLNPK